MFQNVSQDLETACFIKSNIAFLIYSGRLGQASMIFLTSGVKSGVDLLVEQLQLLCCSEQTEFGLWTENPCVGGSIPPLPIAFNMRPASIVIVLTVSPNIQ
jgi:hypothetical protein